MNLTFDHISKEYTGKFAVNDFSLELTEGVYGLLGPNGSGKTTLMRVMVDILKPSRGRILVDGEDIRMMGYRYRDLLGYLPQNFGVYKNFTAQRFLMYIASLKGLSKKQALKKTSELLELVNLFDFGAKKISTFSGGMKQRLGIAQALLNDPKILVLDEPTAGLDPTERIRFRNLLSEISGKKIVLLSTHIVSDIEYIAKEVIMIKKGELIIKDDPQKILQKIGGRVWQALITETELLSVKKAFKVSNIMRKADGIEIRIISDTKPLPNAIPEIPVLEDISLYYFYEEEQSNGIIKTRAI